MIEILAKILAKITIIVVENREPFILLLFINVKKSHYPYSLIICWLQLLTPVSGLVTKRSMSYMHGTWCMFIQKTLFYTLPLTACRYRPLTIPLLGLSIPIKFALSDSSKTVPWASCKVQVES